MATVLHERQVDARAHALEQGSEWLAASAQFVPERPTILRA